MPKKRILIVSTVGLIFDGITSVIISYLETMDLSDLDIRVVGTIKVEPTIRRKIESLGCILIDLPNRRNDTFEYFNALRKYIKKEKIDVVHAHGNSATLAVDLLAAKLGGAKKRIAHSHNTKCDQVRADKLLRPLFYHLYTDALACGDDAGKWLYGGRTFTVLKNGREVGKYKFDPVIRERMRKQYGLKNELIIGHVGNFVEQKNHKFLVSVFRELIRKCYDVKLILIGEGVLRGEIKKSVEDIKDRVFFIGNTEHVEDYLQMMDVMMLPSLFEGLPLVLIEWQINGLPCLVSNNVTKECKFSNAVHYMDLDNQEDWVMKICEYMFEHERERRSYDCARIITEAGFDIKSNVETLKQVYLK